ncbi:DoxX family protein [Mariniluteicoccus endophyticus]
MSRSPSPLPVSALFVGMGVLHFAAPKVFDRAVPDWVPVSPRAAHLASGAAEIALGLAYASPATRKPAAWGLVALLAAVYPANLHMARHPERYAPIPRAVLVARLPLQFTLARRVLRGAR